MQPRAGFGSNAYEQLLRRCLACPALSDVTPGCFFTGKVEREREADQQGLAESWSSPPGARRPGAAWEGGIPTRARTLSVRKNHGDLSSCGLAHGPETSNRQEKKRWRSAF